MVPLRARGKPGRPRRQGNLSYIADKRLESRAGIPNNRRMPNLRFGACALLVSLAFAGCQTSPSSPPISRLPASEPSPPAAIPSWAPLDSWAGQNGVNATGPKKVGDNYAYTLRSSAGTLELVTNSRLATWNGAKLWLGYAPRLTNRRPHVHAIDLAKNLKPLLKPAPQRISRNRIVIIDPGHGGGNSGARSILSSNKFEKEYSLDWARRLKPMLEKKGWKVFLTRDSDISVSLDERVAIAKRRKADLFVSLHFNSSFPKLDPSGIETYCLTPRGLPSTTIRSGKDDVNSSHPNNAHDAANLNLAARIHHSMLSVTGGVDRGVKRARFMTVLQGQAQPAVLIEAGFLSNPDEARLISSPAYREKLAQAVANAF
ncbi:MAG: N-acetylmuramoyl-L-alanine amidase [Limisphaerales bacterium]|jgi:N-acetylmuramoyl-L-alanine amidase